MSPATVGTGILPPRNNASAHGEGAFACCLLLRHKNETIPHITDMQDHCFMLRNLTQQKRPSEKDLVSGKRDSDPRPQPWQGCALPTELFPQLLFSDGRETASAPRLRASKPAFRDCKYKPKNLFCKIFRRILSQNYSCAARKRKKETPVQMRSRRHARRQRPAANGNKNKAAGNGSLIYIRIALRANPD